MSYKSVKNLLLGALVLGVLCLNTLPGAAAEKAGENDIIALLQKDGGGGAAADHEGDVPASPYFKAVDVYRLKSAGSLIVLEKYRTKQQQTEYTCGPAAAYTVMEHFLGASPDDEMAIAKIMGTHPIGMPDAGTNTRGMCRYFQKKGWTVRSSLTDGSPEEYGDFRNFVVKNLKAGIPVMVENIDWGGHWRVIIGYDSMGDDVDANDVLLMADPYDTNDHCQDGYNIVPAERFFYMWFDAHLFRDGEKDRQWLTAVPKGHRKKK